uniref:Cohesin loading complex subunit SCC4 homolog n=1 Tax=Meloidogyne javanica TaxID=6303 RepID=A0A915LVD8_MELJA
VCKAELPDSPRHPQVHTKLLFIYAEAQLRLGEFSRALEAVNAGIQFSGGSGGVLVECYFRLVKSLILSIQMTDQQELGKSVGELGEILQTVASNNKDQTAINDIRAFCYSIQLCYFLAIGMVKSAKQCLRQLHITVQTAEAAAKNEMSTMNSLTTICWLSPEMLTGFAYVLTVLCNIQFTNFEKAHRYYLTAIRHLGGIKLLMQKSTDSSQIVENRMESFVESMEMLLHEGLSQLYLVKQSPAESLSTGMYATNMKCFEAAKLQFKTAINKGAKELELWTLANLGLALVYLYTSRDADFYELYDAISPLKLRSQANSTKSAALLVQGFHYFLNSKQQESKDVLNAACEWANKSGDNLLLLWAKSETSFFEGGNEKQIGVINEVKQQREQLEINRNACIQTNAHKLMIQWTGGEIPREVLE